MGRKGRENPSPNSVAVKKNLKKSKGKGVHVREKEGISEKGAYGFSHSRDE